MHLSGLLLGIAAAHGPASPSYDFAVKVTGHGPPVILVPGLMCGGGVWDGTLDHLKDRYTCHVLTLPGFAGQPPIRPPLLSHLRDEIETYVIENKLDHPVLIGHSLGGMLSLWLGIDRPEMFSAIASVDGVPALGYLFDPNQTPTAMLNAATAIRTRFASFDAAQLAASNSLSLPLLITGKENIAKVAKDADRSDPRSVGDAVAELLETDLRPDLGKLTAPLLLIVPGAGATSDFASQALRSRYEAQFRDAPQHKLAVIPNARHFVMLDAPEAFFGQLDEFLSRVVRRH